MSQSIFSNDWKYIYGETPLSSIEAPFYGIAVYLTVIFGLNFALRNAKPNRAENALAVHNFILLIWSAAMAYGLIKGVIVDAISNGFQSTCCRETGGTLGTIWFWCYIFYVSKYYELVDTVFLVLRRKPLDFLHIFHHSAVMPLFGVLLQVDATTFWVAAILNSSVHVIMYYYFMYGALPKDSPLRRFLPSIDRFKIYITRIQIVQFYIDIFGIAAIVLGLPECRGRVVKLFWTDPNGFIKLCGIVLVPSMLIILFSRFYKKTYNKDDKQPTKKRQ